MQCKKAYCKNGILQYCCKMKEQSPRKYNNVEKKKWWQKICRTAIDYNQLLDRTIVSNIVDPEIVDNKIQTSKYNYLSFVPLNLIEQFTKLSNIYFLFIGILQTIPMISLSEGKPTIFIPLIIVVVISMIKDFIQDRKRHRSDQKQNESQVELLTAEIGFAKRQWQVLQVGHIIRVRKDQYFPCDIILLDHNKQQKTAFIETKNLDGETNLKLKKTNEHLHHLRQMPELQLSSVNLQFAFEKPNPFLSTFNGNVKIGDKKYLIQNSNIILRGCSLKINQWAIGLCVYTGHQSKILLNSGIGKLKSSSLQKSLNNYFKYIFIFQLCITFISSVLFGILYAVNYDNIGYIVQNSNVVVSALITWGSWFISFSNFIPISLLVTVEIVRYGQGMKLNKDELCSSKGYFTQVQTSNLNEQLGQVKYVMSDKTGTLTQNLMQFKCLYASGDYFGFNQQSQLKEVTQIHFSQRPALGQINLKNQKVPNVDFSVEQKQRIIKKIVSNDSNGKILRQALLHLSLCHNVIMEKTTYSSSSPDQLALVSFAKFIGYEFFQKNDDNQFIVLEKISNHPQKKLRYKLLHSLQFSSDRKRMSVILQDLNSEDREIILLIKGADQIILPRTTIHQHGQQKNSELLKIQEALYSYACQGLRTLVLAQKRIDNQTYYKWSERYNDALTIVGPERYEAIDKIQSQIEKGLKLVAATAIEDKLQNCVKQTITDLKKSNIKVWMLTGDKKETAVSIGFSCGLIDKDSQRITLDCGAEHAKTLLTNLTSMIHMLQSKKVTVVSGDFIRKIDGQSRVMLQNILLESQSVICCRVSPKDKEYITKMVKKWGVTLAIGDGANDVNMIHCANVGVGVRGIEGSQATRAADYVITEFKLLKRLIVYHGLNFYHRNANVTIFTLYKNMLITFQNLLYGTICLQSATFIFDIWVYQFYNVFFVTFPIVYYGLFDVLYSYKEIKQKPLVYKEGQSSSYFNNKILIRLVIQTFFISAFLIYTVFFSTQQAISSKGFMIYQEWSGNLVLAIVVIVCNIRVIVMSHQLNLIQCIFCALGIILYYLLFFVIGFLFVGDSKQTAAQSTSTGLYWLLIVFISFVIEGLLVLENTARSINLLIHQKQVSVHPERYKAQIQLTKVQTKMKQQGTLSLSNRDGDEIGGYAFAEDEYRNDYQADFQLKKPKSMLL